MALSKEQLDVIVSELAKRGFEGVPTSVEEMRDYIVAHSADERQLADAITMNIGDFAKFRSEIINEANKLAQPIIQANKDRADLFQNLPGFDAEYAEGSKQSNLEQDKRKRVMEDVLPQFDEDLVKERAEAKQKLRDQKELEAKKPTKVKLQGKLKSAVQKLYSAQTGIEALTAQKKSAKEELARLNKELRDQYFAKLNSSFEKIHTEVDLFIRSVGLGASNVAADIYGGLVQFSSNAKYYANEFKKLTERSYEDGVIKLNKVGQSLAKDAIEAFDSFKGFLHEAKKALDPLRSYHHLLKEFKELRIESVEQRKAIANFVAGNAEEAKAVLSEREVAAQLAAAELEIATKKKEHADFLAKLGEIQTEKHKKFARGEQDIEDLKKTQGVYDSARDTAIKALRGVPVTQGGNSTKVPMAKQASKGRSPAE